MKEKKEKKEKEKKGKEMKGKHWTCDIPNLKHKIEKNPPQIHYSNDKVLYSLHSLLHAAHGRLLDKKHDKNDMIFCFRDRKFYDPLGTFSPARMDMCRTNKFSYAPPSNIGYQKPIRQLKRRKIYSVRHISNTAASQEGRGESSRG